MKKKAKFEKIKYFILGIIASAFLFGSGVYAATTYAISSNDVEYQDNSGLGVTNVQAAIDGTCTKFNEKLDSIMKSIYPVGSIYLSTNLSTPSQVAEKLGGTWEVYGQGKTLVGVNSSNSSYSTVNKTGGSSTATLSVYNIPNHQHSIPSLSGSTNYAGDHNHAPAYGGNFFILNSSLNETSDGYAAGAAFGSTSKSRASSTTNAGSHAHTLTTSASATNSCTNCNGKSFSVQNPYITVYMYRRTK